MTDNAGDVAAGRGQPRRRPPPPPPRGQGPPNRIAPYFTAGKALSGSETVED